MTVQNVGKDAEQLELLYVVGGNIKWLSHSGEQLAVSYKVNHVFTTWLTSSTQVFTLEK